jgi:hypothetical protein
MYETPMSLRTRLTRLIAVFFGFMHLAQESDIFSVVLCALCASAVKWSLDTGYN